MALRAKGLRGYPLRQEYELWIGTFVITLLTAGRLRLFPRSQWWSQITREPGKQEVLKCGSYILPQESKRMGSLVNPPIPK